MRLFPPLAATIMAGSTAWAAPLTVTTDLPPVHALVAQVMGDRGDAVLLLDQGSDAHSFQLRPSQARAVAKADLVVWMGPAMTPWLDRALESLGTEDQALALLELPETIQRPYGGGAHHDDHEDHAEHDDHGDHDDEHADSDGTHDHDADHEAHDDHDDQAHNVEHNDDHGGDHEDHDDHDDHDHSGDDPHAWLDPENARLWVTAIAAQLTARDPDGAAIYAANAAQADAALSTLIADVSAQLAPYHDQPIIVFHEAYGHFVARFDVNIAGAVALGDAADPGAGRISALRDTIADTHAHCIFREPQHNPALVDGLASDLGLRVGTLDPSGSALPPGPDLYGALIHGLADAITGCLSEG